MFRRKCLYALASIIPINVKGFMPNQVLPSPIAMQFQKYGDYPVSHYTRIPDIEIPIYTIKEGDIEVPIYLSFYALCMNLNEVGYGWTLHTGGPVCRTIMGNAIKWNLNYA